MTRTLWEPDNRSGDRSESLGQMACSFSLHNEKIICRVVLNRDVVSSDGQHRRKKYSEGNSLIFINDNNIDAWMISNVHQSGIIIPIQAELETYLDTFYCSAQLSIINNSCLDDFFEIGEEDPTPYVYRHNHEFPKSFCHELARGIGAIEHLSWQSGPYRKSSPVLVNWTGDGKTWSTDLKELSQQVQAAINQKDFSRLQSIRLQFAKQVEYGELNSKHLYSMTLDRVLTIGCLTISFKSVDSLAPTTDEKPLDVPWLATKSSVSRRVSVPAYHPLKTIGRVALTPITVCADTVCWTVVIITSPFWVAGRLSHH